MSSKIKSFFFITLISLSLSSALILISCGNPSNIYGAGFTVQDKPIALVTLILDPESHIGKVVKVRGQLAAVCKQKGCYFSLINRSGSKVYVGLEDGKNFTIPVDSEGKMGVVEGKFIFNMDFNNRGWQIIADTVQIYDK